MRVKKYAGIGVSGLAFGLFGAGCHEDPRPLEIRSQDGVNAIYVGDELVHETTSPLTEPSLITGEDGQPYAVTFTENDRGLRETFVSLRVADGWRDAKKMDYRIKLRNLSFDPLSGLSNPIGRDVGLDQGTDDSALSSGLQIIQFKTQATDAYRAELEAKGVNLHQYIHNHAFVAEIPANKLKEVQNLDFVRWVGPVKSAYKVSRDVLPFLAKERVAETHHYVVVPTEPSERQALVTEMESRGVNVITRSGEGFVIEANLDGYQVAELARLPQLMWIEPATEAGDDMNNARSQGGANFLESLVDPASSGYTGIGIRGHVMEGIDPTHPDFQANQYRQAPIAVDNGEPSSHGHSTYGIIFGDGTGDPTARGLMPNAQGYYTNYDAVMNTAEGSTEKGSRYELVGRLIKEHKIMFQTASWGYAVTTEYTARSAEMDKLIFDFDLPITQSQSNTGSRESRPQAWAKNIISVGAVYHFDNDDPSDDAWDGKQWSMGSIGPATDGRIKPDLCAYYDKIHTTGLTGYTEFGGTSGATPIVAGYLGLSLEMWTNGVFGNHLDNPVNKRFENRPHFTTSKAMMINTAAQYKFAGADHDLTRVHQGWGFPSLRNMYEKKDKFFIVNEDKVLKNQESATFDVEVADETPELKVTMVYADPAGNLMNEVTRVNNLDLKVTAPDGTVYWGNQGLVENNYSVAGGEPNKVDTVENVFIKTPAMGHWKIEVIADEVNVDSHVETAEVDADFALVASGVSH